jgi:hypothetical protein
LEASGEVVKNRISVEALGNQAGGFVVPYSPREFSDKTVAPGLILKDLYPSDQGYADFRERTFDGNLMNRGWELGSGALVEAPPPDVV